MEDLFLKIKGELLQQGRNNFVASVIASSICFTCHKGIITEKEAINKVKELQHCK